MEKEYLISVIIPVYNGEIYLRECVDSVLGQSFTDFELILVNDGSKDTSGDICNEYAKLDSRIKVIHQANGGVTSARHIGVQKARGEWICFVDCDDTIPNDSLSSLFECCQLYDTDIVVGHYQQVPFSPPSQISLKKWRENCCAGVHLSPTPFAKLIRKSLFTEWVLDIPRNVFNGEDMLMNIRLAFNMTKDPVEVHKRVYNYRRNLASVTHTKPSSLEYEELFDRVREQSIPTEELPEYMKSIIRCRLNGLTSPAHFEPKVLCNKQQTYLIRLKEDIKKYHYRMSFQEWMMLNIRWPWMYKLYSFLILVKNSLRYRLGLNN